jgi:hypothetical protein
MLKETLLKFFKIDGLIENISGYIEARAELLKIEVKEEITRSMAKLSFILAVTICFLIAIIFMSVGLAFYIGQLINPVVGFLIVGALYFLGGIVISYNKEAISHRLEKKNKRNSEAKEEVIWNFLNRTILKRNCLKDQRYIVKRLKKKQNLFQQRLKKL